MTKRLVLVGAQLGALVSINEAGHVVASATGVPLPGNLLGMLFLLALLRSRVVHREWLDETSSFLNRHLAFFFIPITVGLMGVSTLLLRNGGPLLTTLLASAAIGICACGFVAERLAQRLERVKRENPVLEGARWSR